MLAAEILNRSKFVMGWAVMPQVFKYGLPAKRERNDMIKLEFGFAGALMPADWLNILTLIF